MKLSITTTRSGPKLSEAVTFPIECPHCGHKIKLKVAGVKTDPLITCPACNNKIQIESGGTLRETADKLADVDRAWEGLFKN